MHLGQSAQPSASGAISATYQNRWDMSKAFDTTGNANAGYGALSFDASKSSSLYTDGLSEIRVKALCGYMLIRYS